MVKKYENPLTKMIEMERWVLLVIFIHLSLTSVWILPINKWMGLAVGLVAIGLGFKSLGDLI